MQEYVKIELIEQFIKEQGVTNTEFCKLCKISYSTFSKIKRGAYNVKINAIFKIARTVGVKAHELFY